MNALQRRIFTALLLVLLAPTIMVTASSSAGWHSRATAFLHRRPTSNNNNNNNNSNSQSMTAMRHVSPSPSSSSSCDANDRVIATRGGHQPDDNNDNNKDEDETLALLVAGETVDTFMAADMGSFGFF